MLGQFKLLTPVMGLQRPILLHAQPPRILLEALKIVVFSNLPLFPLMVELLLLTLLLVLMLPIRNSVIKKVWTSLPLKRQDQLRYLILLVTNSVKLLLLLLL